MGVDRKIELVWGECSDWCREAFRTMGIADDESRYTVAVFTKMNQWWAVCNLQSGRGVFGLW